MLLQANALHIPLADGSVHCAVCSPPYWGLRDYGTSGQLGLEPTPAEYVENMVAVFREVWRVLRDDGTLWLNLGDSYTGGVKGHGGVENSPKQRSNAGSYFVGKQYKPDYGDLKEKDLVGIPWRVAFALQADGWYLRSDIIWAKPNPMPESVTDRPTKAHEYLFLLSKSARYFYDAEAVKEPQTGYITSAGNEPMVAKKMAGTVPGIDGSSNEQRMKEHRSHMTLEGGRNRRTVWEIATAPYSGAHFATYPPALVEPCILAGTSAAGVCACCGAPWERVTEREAELEHGRLTLGYGKSTDAGGNTTNGHGGSTLHHKISTSTTGWQPTCDHDAATVPAIVLDPFAGSGTTGQVARLHGRRFVGLDISREYLATLALPRAEGRQTAASIATLPLFAQAGV